MPPLRLVAQTALQPGVLTALKKILRQGKDNCFVYLYVDKELARCTYGELRR